tara:strand:- start:3365 stop:4384 length:1020 start_codon:yes stop_codon:yes gene_type:complete
VNYYNEFDPFAAKWLKQLISDKLIPDGDVDERSIVDVSARELSDYTQCHFFAGIGGWSRALELAGWDSNRPVWTGSPPCQSFSVAGKGKGKDDARHLWPVFFNLIRECQPPAVFGEQVAAAIRHGWLDDLQNDFEKEGYASGACVLPSGAVGSPHKRDRLFFTAKFVADTDIIGHERSWKMGRSSCTKKDKNREASSSVKSCANDLSVADSNTSQRERGRLCRGDETEHDSIRRDEAHGVMADSSSDGFSKGSSSESSKRPEDRQEGSKVRSFASDSCDINFWSESTVVHCRDGKDRPIPTESALFPLANGIPNRVGILRGAGNAIVPQAAAEIIKAVM